MKTATFENTVDILVKAYLNGTLAHGTCAACAVGNIVADTMKTEPVRSKNSRTGFKYNLYKNGEFAKWDDLFVTTEGKNQHLYPQRYSGKIKEQVDSTGYTWLELARIEHAFETAPRNCHHDEGGNEEWMFNGLMAVVDVLADIHKISLEQKSVAKAMFVKETTL